MDQYANQRNIPSVDTGPHIKHYYGNVVRVLFIVLAVFVAVCVPLSGEMEIALYVAGPLVIALILLAGLTNPHSSTIFTINTVISGLGLLFAELLALGAYAASNMPFFLILELVTCTFIGAFYYSVKTMRASRMHMIGKDERAGEFDTN